MRRPPCPCGRADGRPDTGSTIVPRSTHGENSGMQATGGWWEGQQRAHAPGRLRAALARRGLVVRGLSVHVRPGQDVPHPRRVGVGERPRVAREAPGLRTRRAPVVHPGAPTLSGGARAGGALRARKQQESAGGGGGGRARRWAPRVRPRREQQPRHPPVVALRGELERRAPLRGAARAQGEYGLGQRMAAPFHPPEER